MTVVYQVIFFILKSAFAMLHLHSTGAVNASAAQQNSKLVWKVKPQPYQLAKEHDSVKLNCEFEYSAAYNASTGGNAGAEKYFVIWYKDGASQNVLSLNDQLARPNSTSYEITGTYNLIIKNLTREHSGLYTCQLFQSLDLVASVNLTVLGRSQFFIIINQDYSRLKFCLNVRRSSGGRERIKQCVCNHLAN